MRAQTNIKQLVNAGKTTPIPLLVPVVVIAAEEHEEQMRKMTMTPTMVTPTSTIAMTTPEFRGDPLVEAEVSELTKTIERTIENNEEAIEEGLEPGETLKKDDFDAVFDEEKELRPIVKTILENGDREGDYIIEDIPSVHFTANTILPTTILPMVSTTENLRIPETVPPTSTVTITVTSTPSQAGDLGENPSSTYNTIKTSPSATWTSPGTTTIGREDHYYKQVTTETGSTSTEFVKVSLAWFVFRSLFSVAPIFFFHFLLQMKFESVAWFYLFFMFKKKYCKARFNQIFEV